MPKFQKESFIKSFLLFFTIIEIFLIFIYYTNIKEAKTNLNKNLFLQMKNYSYDFKNSKFDIDIINDTNQSKYELHNDKNFIYILVDIKNKNNDILKILYKKNKYTEEVNEINTYYIKQFILLSIVCLIISFLFSIYSLYPLQKSYLVLQEFIKDIIHDINTPLSSIKINLSFLNNKEEEIQSIEQSVNILEMLHKNLDNYSSNATVHLQNYNIKEIIQEQIDFFQDLYDYIKWDININDETIYTDKYLLSRVIYNLINNACKYNISNGYIDISYKNKKLELTNPSYGIKNPKKVFDRFYKESPRGLGIGLHIVTKILKLLNTNHELKIDKNNIVSFVLTFR